MIPEVRATLADNNPKGILQQHVLRQMGLLPRYEMLREVGRVTIGVTRSASSPAITSWPRARAAASRKRGVRRRAPPCARWPGSAL